MGKDPRIDVEDLELGGWVCVRIPLANPRTEFGEDRLEGVH